MLLVMNTTSLFDPDQPLTVITKDRIQTFFPGLWDEVFKISTPSPIIEVRLGQSLISDLSQVYSSRWHRFQRVVQ